MIKKINIALAVVFVVLLGFKLLLDFAESAKKNRCRSVAAQPLPSEVSTLAPRVYFTRWPPYFDPNVVTRRNGFCLDLIREIFPNADFDDSKNTSRLDVVLEILRTDPNAVIAEYGDMERLKEFPSAEVRIAKVVLCVFTPRTSDWLYAGPESLDSLRLGWSSDYDDSPVLRAFAEKWKNTPGKVVVREESQGDEDYFWDMIQRDKLDGFVMSFSEAEVSRVENDSKAFVRFRRSEPIDSVPLLFRASNVDPDLSRRICDEFDNGVRRLYRSGFIRRLAEYYVKDLRSLGINVFTIPLEGYGEGR